MACKLILSPVTGERIESNLYNDLVEFTGTTAKAEELFSYTNDPKFTQRFGAWAVNESNLEVDVNGELVLNNTLKGIFNKTAPAQDLSNLSKKLKHFIERAGFSYETVEEIIAPNGQSVRGVTDFMTKTVKLINGEPIDTLAEEAGHIYVAWLEQNGKLPAAILDGVTTYPEYQKVLDEYSEIYENDAYRLKKETLGKLLVKHLKGETISQDTNKVRGIKAFVDAALSFFRRKFNNITTEQFTDFLDLAAETINGNKIDISLRTNNYREFDLTPAIESKINRMKTVAASIQKTEVVRDGIEVETYFVNGKKADRISNRITKMNERVYGKMTEEQKAQFEPNRVTGSFGHDDIQNVIERFVEKRDGKHGDALTPRTNNLSAQEYNKLENYISKVLSEFDPNTVFLPEMLVYDKKKNLAGTIDFIAIEPDGTVHILDWKFVDSSKKGFVSKAKRDAWNIQLNSYKSTLESYGFSKFGKLRMMPIQTNYVDGKFESLTINNTPVFQDSAPALTERTGNEDLDKIVNKLVNDYEQIKAGTAKGAVSTKVSKDVVLGALQKAVKQIQIDKNLDSFIRNTNAQLKEFEELMSKDALTAEQINQISIFTDFYSNLNRLDLQKFDVDKDGKPRGKIDEISKRSIELEKGLKSHLEAFNKLHDLDVTSDKVMLAPQGLSSRLSNVGTFKNPVFQLFNRLRRDKNNLIKKEYDAYVEKVSELIKELKANTDTDNIFDAILKKVDGKYTGNLISKTKQEFYTKLANNSGKWVEANTVHSEGAKELFDKELAERLATEKKFADTKQEAVFKVNRWREYNDFFYKEFKDKAYANFAKTGKSSKYIEPSSAWNTNEYNEILKNPDAPISQLYNLFQDTIKQARKHSNNPIYSTFIPSIEKTFIRKVLASGSMGAIKDNVIDNFSMQPYEQQLDLNGEPVFKIPLKYTNDLRGDKSLELGKVFSLFHHSVLQNKYLGEMEQTAHVLAKVLKTGRYFKTDWKGNFIEKKDSNGNVIGKERIDPEHDKDFEETERQFRDLINIGIYQTKNTAKDFEIFGKSGIKVIDSAMSYFSMLVVGLSPVTSFANFIGGEAMLLSVGAKGNFFNRKDVIAANADLAKRDRRAITLAKYFDVISTNNTYKKAQSLDSSSFGKHMTWDKVYIGLEIGEWQVQNAALNAFLRGHTINKDGQLARKGKEDKSILELTTIGEDGKPKIEGMTDAIFDNIRQKVKGINNEVMGAMSEDDIILAQADYRARVALQFKRWALPMAKARFGGLTYNDNLELYEEGRFLSMAHTVKNRTKILIDDLFGLYGGAETKEERFIDTVRTSYEAILAKNPGFADDLSFEDYLEVYNRNIRSAMHDLITLGGFTSIVAGMKSLDEDDELSAEGKLLSHGLARTMLELTFWTDPDSILELNSNGIVPVFGLLTRASELIKATVDFAFYEDGDGERLSKAFKRSLIGTNQMDKLSRLIERL